MSIPLGSASSNTNGGPTARLLSDPNTTTCPDFSSDAFKTIRLQLAGANGDEAAVISDLQSSWKEDNDRLKVQWDAQVATDRQAQEAEDARLQQEADQATADAARIAEEEKLEAEKKKPKLGDFDVNSAPPSFVESPISPFAQRKLERKEYCPLWPFTPSGLKEAADTAFPPTMMSRRLGSHAMMKISSPTHKNMTCDEHLTWRQFSLGSNRYIKEIIRARWPEGHVQALTQFFYALDQHDLHSLEDDGENILKIYADRYRADWFRTLGTEQSFNIAIIKEEAIGKIADEYFAKKQKQITDESQAM
ncbi:hypothetical protein B0H14DRAFT_2565840 [Mycena olivaceomarginata]|nr:hypothetical protein B0H14DRAFT_2565840 [Mycena olivaceomarginata]